MKDPDEEQPADKRFHTRCGHVKHGLREGLCATCLFQAARPRPEKPPQPKNRSSRKSVRFDKYEIHEKLGEGGMGVVHRAVQLEPIRRVVGLKRIRDGQFANAAARRKFLEEAKIAAELRHPHIVPIYEVGESKGTPFFTMELMSGGTLAQHISRFSKPSPAAALIQKLARAVHAGHQHRILHRDLKPANILFDQRHEPHIADFGVAKRLGEKNTTYTKTIAGTIPYMAPEQVLLNEHRNSEAADIWSLGVMLYELLAGKLPFQGSTFHEIAECIVRNDPPPFERSFRIDRELETIVRTCLNKEPRQRYVSAEHLAEDLRRFLRGEPIWARRPGPFEQIVRFVRNHPVLVNVFVVATLSLVLLTSWALTSAREQERARRQEVLEANAYAARAVAGTVLAKVLEYANVVAAEAREPELPELIEQGDEERLTRHMQVFYERHGVHNSPIDFWFVMTREGFAMAHTPVQKYGKSYFRDYRFRDYFRHATSLPKDADLPVYVSRALLSNADDRYKVAFASPLRNKEGVIQGILVAMISTDRHFGALQLSDQRRIAALAVRRDRDFAEDPLPDEYLLLMHDGVLQGEGVTVESNALRRLTARRNAATIHLQDQLRLPPADWVETEDDFMDRLAEPELDGRQGVWLAGMAPVGHTELTVIVQTRVEDATALDHYPFRVLAAWSIGGALLLFGGLWLALRPRKRRITSTIPALPAGRRRPVHTTNASEPLMAR